MNQKQVTRRNFLRAARQITPRRTPTVSDQNTVATISSLIGLDGYTPTDNFYRQQLRYVPQITPVFWALRLYGLVEKGVILTHDKLAALPFSDMPCTIACIGGSARHPMIGHALWSGIPMGVLLDRVRPASNARYAQFYAADGYTTYVETEKLENALLAFHMNGAPLPREHGYPARIIMPGLYGYKMPKWIQRIEFTDSPTPGFWEERGWSVTGAMQTMSTILTPRHLESAKELVQLSGVAYAGERSITAIEISVNDTPWMPVPFTESEPYSWTRWQIDWTPPAPGDYLIKVRASDSGGFTQAEATTAFPHGQSAIHTIVVHVTS